MSTSGTYSFSPALSLLVKQAYGRIGIRGPQIVAEHMKDAEVESNLLLCAWSSDQPNLWLSELISVALVQGTATYTLPSEFVAIQVAYVAQSSGGSAYDRPLGAMSTVEYFSQPNKTTQGPPTSYWFDRQITPQITMWPVPDGAATYTLKIRGVRQVQDASMPNGTGVEIPYRFYDAFTAGLSHRLARIYAPSFEDKRGMDADKAWEKASGKDVEQVPFYISPATNGYYR